MNIFTLFKKQKQFFCGLLTLIIISHFCLTVIASAETIIIEKGNTPSEEDIKQLNELNNQGLGNIQVGSADKWIGKAKDLLTDEFSKKQVRKAVEKICNNNGIDDSEVIDYLTDKTWEEIERNFNDKEERLAASLLMSVATSVVKHYIEEQGGQMADASPNGNGGDTSTTPDPPSASETFIGILILGGLLALAAGA